MNKRSKVSQMTPMVRRGHGQAIVEAGAMMVVMTTLVALLILGLINTYFVATYNLRVQCVASDAARKYSSSKWWLGVERPEWNADDAAKYTFQNINEELVSMGLPPADAKSFKIDATQTVMLREKKITLVRVDFDVKNMQIAPGLCFPAALAIHASGVSSDAEDAVTKHGEALIMATNPNNPSQQVGLRVPIYDATNANGTPAWPTWLRAGESAGVYPEAFLQLQCSSAGSSLSLQDTPQANKTDILKTEAWTGSVQN